MASVEIPFLKVVLDADPDFYKDQRRRPEYEFTRRTFYADDRARGVYDITGYAFDDSFDDAYATLALANRQENGHA